MNQKTGPHNTVLYQLLATVPVKEWTSLKQFIASPYFNKAPQILSLLEALLAYHPHFKIEDKSTLFKDAPPEKCTPAYIHEMFRKLSRLIERFMVEQELKRRTVLAQNIALMAYKERNLPLRFKKMQEKITREISTAIVLNSESIHYQWWQQEIYHHFAEVQISAEVKAIPEPYLDEMYVLHKLKYFCNTLAQTSFYQLQESNFNLLKEEILRIAQSHFLKHELIQLYLQLFYLLKREEKQPIEQTIQQYYYLYDRLDDHEKYFILINFVNIANTKIKQGALHLVSAILALYQFVVAQGFFLVQNRLKENTFLNICNFGANAKAKEWTINFIQTHRDLLPKTTRKATANLGLGTVYFHHNQFEIALDLLPLDPPNQLDFNLRIRSLRLRCLLELFLIDRTYQTTLIAHIQAFRGFLNRDRKLKKGIKKSYQNLNNAVSKIADLALMDWNKEKVYQKHRVWLETIHPIISKSWLIAKLEVAAEG